MLRTTRIIIPSAMLSILVLGLAAIYNGGSMEVQWGRNNLIRIEGTQVQTDDDGE